MRRYDLVALGSLAVLLAPIAAFAALRLFPSADPAFMHFRFHFWVVGATSLAAATTATVSIVAAPSLRETRLLFLALAFMAIAGLFSVHGLMTPGVIQHEFYQSLPVSAWLSIAVGAAFVALSAVELPERARRALDRGGSALFAWTAVALATYIVLSFTAEGWLDGVPTDDRHIQYAIGLGSFMLIAFATWRYAQAWLFARLPAQLAMVGALALLAQVPPILVWGQVWHLSWWIYHATYGAAFTVLLTGWAVEARRAGSLRAIADALSMRDALAALNRGRDRHVLELVDAIEAKDVATLGHVSRVAAYALTIGRRLGLGPGELRALVLAAQMHDVGKIGIPDAILGKPGPLSAQEFAEVRLHTRRGHAIAERVPALRDLAPVIRAHHERLDGSGYPDALRGDEIPLLARIIAVADSYDAMTSARPYRQPLSHEDAVAELRRVRGVQLDPACVDAFLAEHEAEARAA
jgi:HD-GYP domain-containing protein (c-di-GMP phosphodiesterase class II)